MNAKKYFKRAGLTCLVAFLVTGLGAFADDATKSDKALDAALATTIGK